MKEIFITHKQKEILEQIIKESKVPAAQGQINKKVNSGIMDAVTGCGMYESAEPESDEYHIGLENDSNLEYAHVFESVDNNELKAYIKSILEYFYSEGLNIKPYPKIFLDDTPQEGLFIKTGYYLPSEMKVVVFINGRNDKDALRSLCHELIHHMQNLEGQNMNFGSEDNVKDNKALEKLEAEAYLKGNIYFRKWTEHEQQKQSILSEHIMGKSGLMEFTSDLDESLSPDEVDLSSFNIKKNLNPKFWKDGKLDSRIRMKLLDIADDFIEFLGIDWVKPEDITITGSLANYNWNEKYSDIDLHVIMDYSKVDKREDFVSNYFYSLKKTWNDEHQDLKIFGFPVEVYVQNKNEKHNSSGVYSLEKNKWLDEPERDKIAKVKVNKTTIKEKVSNYTKEIDNLKSDLKNCGNDEYKLRKLSEKAEKVFNKLKEARKKSLKTANSEITEDNIIFKCLRRLGYIEKISSIISDIYNKMNSLS